MVGLLLALQVAAAVPAPSRAERDLAGLRERVIRAAPAHRDRARLYLYLETVTVYEPGSGEEWVPRPSRTYRVFPVESFLYRRLVGIGGLPLDDRQERREQAREEEFRRRRQGFEEPEGGRWRRILRLEDFVSNYEYRLLGTESLDGREAIVLDFQPGEWKADLAGPLDRILRKLGGRIWIDSADFQVVRVEGTLRAKVRWGLGLVASLNSLELELSQRKVNGEAWLPEEVVYRAEGTTFLIGRLRKRSLSRFHDYRRIDPLLGPGAAATSP
ncbi:MAG: hypothetical protein HY509_00515 [Acidobacteria bacterium]|nr:hypothetical protein [Acidobacteriota bacterium]